MLTMIFENLSLNPNEYVFMIFKILDLVLFTAIAVKIYKLRPDYILNRLFGLAFLFWAGYILMDSIIWLIAPFSITLYNIASVLRDVQIICVISVSLLIYNSQKVIARGEKGLFNPRFYLELGGYIILSILVLIFDGVAVYDANDKLVSPEDLPLSEPGFRAAPDMGLMVMVLAAIPIFVYVYALIDQVNTSRKINDPLLKRRMQMLTLGLSLIPVGIIYFIVQNVYHWYSLWIVLIGYLFWTISPYFIWKSQQKEKQGVREEKSAAGKGRN